MRRLAPVLGGAVVGSLAGSLGTAAWAYFVLVRVARRRMGVR